MDRYRTAPEARLRLLFRLLRCWETGIGMGFRIGGEWDSTSGAHILWPLRRPDLPGDRKGSREAAGLGRPGGLGELLEGLARLRAN